MMARPDRFTDRVAVVTGSAQGIGRVVAEGMAAEGARVVLADRAPFVEEVAAGIRAAGGVAEAIITDLEQWEGAVAAVDAAVTGFGRLDILVNNVGGTIRTRPFHRYGIEQIVAEINRSLYPTLWGCRAALPVMLAQGGGTIVNVSSIATRSLRRVPYAAAKGGVNAMTASLAFEYAPFNIRVVATAPGGTEAPPRRKPRTDDLIDEEEQAWYQEIVDQTIESSLMKRYGTLAEQAAPILFMASDEAAYITGSTLPVGGGDLG